MHARVGAREREGPASVLRVPRASWDEELLLVLTR